MLDKDRKVYYEWLLEYGERAVIDRRARIRAKCVETTYKECDKSIPYEVRNGWIEARIEMRFKYFDRLNDMGSKGSDI